MKFCFFLQVIEDEDKTKMENVENVDKMVEKDKDKSLLSWFRTNTVKEEKEEQGMYLDDLIR